MSDSGSMWNWHELCNNRKYSNVFTTVKMASPLSESGLKEKLGYTKTSYLQIFAPESIIPSYHS